MAAWVNDWYYWLKVLHIVAVISWMAGMLYLPRLFVYHAGLDPAAEAARLLTTMERRLYRMIMTPAMLVAFGSGGILLTTVNWSAGWVHTKLLAVVCLGAMHGMMAGWHRDLAAGRSTKSPRFFRLANEIPTLLMVVIVIMVIVKPF